MRKAISILALLLFALAAFAQAPSGACTVNNPGAGAPVIVYNNALYTCAGQNWGVLWNPDTNFGFVNAHVAHAQYNFANDGGAVGTITPVNNFTLPTNAVIMNVVINSTTAVTSAGAATVAIGTTVGSSATSLLTATGKASFTSNAFVQGVPVPQTASTFVKLSASGQLQVTVGTAALTAGVIEVYVFYYTSST